MNRDRTEKETIREVNVDRKCKIGLVHIGRRFRENEIIELINYVMRLDTKTTSSGHNVGKHLLEL